MNTYTVKQIAKSAGVSVRTLHHYHEIGLLLPRHVGANGYRYYSEAELLRLQQILLYRCLGLKLAQVHAILDAPDFDTLSALQHHKIRLEDEAKRLPLLIQTLDRTIKTIKENKKMRVNDLYKGLSPEKQASYEAELLSQGGPEMATHLRHASAHNAAKPKAEASRDMAELESVESGLAANMAAGVSPERAENTALVARHRAWVSAMWGRDCTPQAHVGLAQIYEASPDFESRYETIAHGFTRYICAAIRQHSGEAGED